MGQILRISAFINQWKKDRRVRICITVAAVFVSALIQSYALQVFVRIYWHGHACGTAGGIEGA
jgi:hypothetical protein